MIYSYGSSAKIRRLLVIFPNYPKIEPGSSIYVPEKPKGGFDAAKTGVIVSALSGLVTALALILR